MFIKKIPLPKKKKTKKKKEGFPPILNLPLYLLVS